MAKKPRYKTAEEMGKEQKEISVSEFFSRNRHLLGFDNPSKALLMVVKEGIDNSIDAAFEAGILPELFVTIKEPREVFRILDDEGIKIGKVTKTENIVELQIRNEKAQFIEKKERGKKITYIFKHGDKTYKFRILKKRENVYKLIKGRTEMRISKMPSDRYLITVEDNGPGIVKEQVSKIFGKLLYGSKFFKMRQTMGQQGLGVSMSVLYSQLTTGRATRIWSRTSPKKHVYYCELRIDTEKNEPVIVKEKNLEDGFRDHGTKIELEIEGKYTRGGHSVLEYLKEIAISNPFAKIIYRTPDGKEIIFKRAVNKLPALPKEIKPHPYGVELGILERMMKLTKTKTLSGFLTGEFCRIGAGKARQICELAGLKQTTNPKRIDHEHIEWLWRAMQAIDFMKPPMNCLSPIGEKKLEVGMKKEYNLDFVTAISRPTCVYRGMPFKIECCIGICSSDEQTRIMRFANRVPLLYQASSCAITKAIQQVDWKRYGIPQQGNMPAGPIITAVHMASVWIPYTSESKEAVDPYPEIVKEIKLALQDCARKVASYLRGRKRLYIAQQRKSLFEKYIPELAKSLSKLSGTKKEKIEKGLGKILKKGEIDEEKT